MWPGRQSRAFAVIGKAKTEQSKKGFGPVRGCMLGAAMFRVVYVVKAGCLYAYGSCPSPELRMADRCFVFSIASSSLGIRRDRFVERAKVFFQWIRFKEDNNVC